MDFTVTSIHTENGYVAVKDLLRGKIADTSDLEHIAANIDSITNYELPENARTFSYFTYKDYIVSVKSVGKRDSRNYLEREITVYNINIADSAFFVNALSDETKHSVTRILAAPNFNKCIYTALMFAALSENTRVYFLAYSQKQVETARALLFLKVPAGLLYRGSCIEAVNGVIPEVKTSAVICRCKGNDAELYKQTIKHDSNCVIIDLSTDFPSVAPRIDRANYAQSVLNHMLFQIMKPAPGAPDNSAQQAHTLFSIFANNVPIKFGLNVAAPVSAFFSLKKLKPELLKAVPINEAEKDIIRKYIKGGGR